MQKVFVMTFVGLLAGCIAPEEPGELVDGNRLTVRQDNAVPWPAPATVRSSSRELVNVEPFPLVSALVVERADGGSLSKADELLARRAANSYCAGLSAGDPGPNSRYLQGRWAFGLCT